MIWSFPIDSFKIFRRGYFLGCVIILVLLLIKCNIVVEMNVVLNIITNIHNKNFLVSQKVELTPGVNAINNFTAVGK